MSSDRLRKVQLQVCLKYYPDEKADALADSEMKRLSKVRFEELMALLQQKETNVLSERTEKSATNTLSRPLTLPLTSKIMEKTGKPDITLDDDDEEVYSFDKK
mmetsp:Transcript_821/g.860  ORF Transcript_821/g.860 Transcript_821/m.860 type:complete len:103 (+) Transcript_821:3-311(+)